MSGALNKTAKILLRGGVKTVLPAKNASSKGKKMDNFTVLLERIYFKPKYTIGKIFVQGQYLCDSLELPLDADGDGKTNEQNIECIPAGTYFLNLTFSALMQKYYLEVVGVPGRTGIRIHPANFPAQLKGCIAVGRGNAAGQLIDSKYYYDKLIDKFFEAVKDNTRAAVLKIIGAPNS